MPTHQITPVMPQIKTVVMIMLENRSLDNLLGFLYAHGQPFTPVPAGSSPVYDGSAGHSNSYHNSTYACTDGTQGVLGCDEPLRMPNWDPHEDYPHVLEQLYADHNGTMPAGNYWSTTPPMTGFAWDYDEIWTANQAVMGSYSSAQLPVMSGLALNYAVSDRWFSSVPTQTFANRAFMFCGTSLGKVSNDEINPTGQPATYANTDTIFNKLAAAGKTWGVYHNAWSLAGGEPINQVFSPWLCPRIALSGVHDFDNAQDPDSFLEAAAAGTLPNFCFLEPKWSGGVGPVYIQGTDYHPPAFVCPGEAALNDLYNTLLASPQWPNMLLIVTFDEHGGTYDHVPPPAAVSPDGIVGPSGFTFDRLGVRVPTLLISPYIQPNIVFRAAGATDYDHASFIATLLKWAGLDPASAGMGVRVANAPTFEGVLGATPRVAPFPTFTVPAGYATQGFPDMVAHVDQKAGENNLGAPAPIHLADFRALSENAESPQEFLTGLTTLRYGK